jgi:hypothetical protein
MIRLAPELVWPWPSQVKRGDATEAPREVEPARAPVQDELAAKRCALLRSRGEAKVIGTLRRAV